MFKKAVSGFFIVLFLGVISAPSVIIAMNDSIDISILYSLSEEETNNLKLVVSETDEATNLYLESFITQKLGYYLKKYPKPHINLISPPPDFNKG